MSYASVFVRAGLPIWALPAAVALLAAVLAPLVLERVHNCEALHERIALLLVSGLDVQNWFDKVDAALQVLVVVSLNQHVQLLLSVHFHFVVRLTLHERRGGQMSSRVLVPC